MYSWQIGLNLELTRNALLAGNSPLQVGHCWWQLCILVNLTRNMTFLQNGYKWYLSGFNVLAQLLLNLELPRNALLATNSPLHCRLDTARGSCVLSSSVPIIFPQFASTTHIGQYSFGTKNTSIHIYMKVELLVHVEILAMVLSLNKKIFCSVRLLC